MAMEELEISTMSKHVKTYWKGVLDKFLCRCHYHDGLLNADINSWVCDTADIGRPWLNMCLLVGEASNAESLILGSNHSIGEFGGLLFQWNRSKWQYDPLLASICFVDYSSLR